LPNLASRQDTNHDLCGVLPRDELSYQLSILKLSPNVNDLKYTFRQLVMNPGFTAVAVLTLALGIGANTAIFSIVNGLLLRPLPYHDSQRLAIIWTHSPGANVAQDWPSPGQFSAIKTGSDVFEGLALARGNVVVLTGRDAPEQLSVVELTSTVFPLLGVQPALGRVFLPEEDTPGKPLTVVLTYGFWQRRFGGDPGIIGREINLNSENYAIVGVMPKDFSLDYEVMPTVGGSVRPELFLPLPVSSERMNNHGDENYNVLARLKPGVTIAQAQVELNYVAQRLEQEFPKPYPASRSFRFSIRPLLEQAVGDVRLTLYALVGAVACVLLIACANVANLLLARGAAREKEIAIRTAIGASRWQVVRQLLTESLVLAVLGGALGLLLAAGGLKALRALSPGNIPRLQEISMDARVLIVTSGIVLLTSFLFGLAPALRNLRVNLTGTLKEGGRGLVSARHRMGNLLAATEIALSLVLAVSAGLLIRSLTRVQQVQPGFVPQQVLSMRLALFGSPYPDDTRRAAFYEQVLERVRSLPGVESAGVVSILPLAGGISWGGITIEDYDLATGQSAIQADQRIAGVGYFETMKIPLIQGRLFNEQDRKESLRVAIIDENMARTYWRNGNAVGKRLKLGSGTNSNPWLTVVGVIANVKQYGLDTDSRVAFYTPHSQVRAGTMYLTIRTRSDPVHLASAVTKEVRSLEPNVLTYDIKTMAQWLSGSLARRRFAMLALGLFAGVAMLLTAVGIYGLMSYTMTQRTREIGVRVALGAQRRDVLSMVIRQAVNLGLIGTTIGLVGCLVVMRLVGSMLYGISPSDPWTLAGASMLLVIVTISASWLPAHRAATIDPIEALRSE
jgi:predicted permease